MSRVWLFELLRICEEPVSCCRPMAAIFLLETSLPFPDSNYRPLIVSQKLMKAPIKWLRVPSCRRPAYIFRPKLFLAFTDCLFQSWTRHMAQQLGAELHSWQLWQISTEFVWPGKSSKSWAHKVRVFGPFTLSAPKSRDLKNIGRGNSIKTKVLMMKVYGSSVIYGLHQFRMERVGIKTLTWRHALYFRRDPSAPWSRDVL